MNIRGIILAAGRGSRMGQATENSHKCLTVLNGKPLLEWQVNAIKGAGVDDVTVVTGYKSEMLNGAFAKVHNDRWAETNMVASLFCNSSFNGDTIISYSDIVYRPEHIDTLLQIEGDICIVVDLEWRSLWELRFENPLDDAETFKFSGNDLLEIGGKTDLIENIQAQYMGLIKVSEKGWNIMFDYYNQLPQERKDKIDMTSMLSQLLQKGVNIKVAFIKGGWCEVDNYSDVVLYEEQLANNSQWMHKWF